MPPELEELEVAEELPASVLGDSMLPGRRQAERLEALLLAKREHDTTLGIIEQCVDTGVLSRSQAVEEIAEAAAALQRAKDEAGLGRARAYPYGTGGGFNHLVRGGQQMPCLGPGPSRPDPGPNPPLGCTYTLQGDKRRR